MTRNPATTFRWRAAAVLSAALGMVACASDVPPPTAQLGASSQAVQEAERANALQYAPVELQAARDKLAAADAAMRADERTRARRLAEEAQVDAELATTRAQHAVTQQAAAAVRQSAVPVAPAGVAPTMSGSTLGTLPAPATGYGSSTYRPAPALSPSPTPAPAPMNSGNSWGYSYPEARP